MLKADLHIHTEYSMDCTLSLQDIIDRCLKKGINCIAIADHGTIEGAVRMQAMAPFPVIIAEEILTPFGEIMGMFLTEGIPSGSPVEETIALIRAQGGLVNIPHPCDWLRPPAFTYSQLDMIAEQIDAIEVFNARSLLSRISTRARAFAQEHDIPVCAGSDAHTAGEVGNAYIEMPEFNGRDEFIKSLAAGRLYGRCTNPMVHFSSTWAKLKKKFKLG